MAVVCASLSWFVADGYNYSPKWKWPKLHKSHTYIIIFAKHQQAIYRAFDKVRDQVNVLTEIKGCTNLVHRGSSKNTIVVFEMPEKMGPPKPRKKRVTCNSISTVPPVPF